MRGTDLYPAPREEFRGPMATLTFLGAAGTVTGSRYLLEAGGERLLVDCGLFEGSKEHRLRNWSSFPVEPSSIRKLVLTHAHLDHTCGGGPPVCTCGRCWTATWW